eukprot:augustus_masked-scaffold_1-processed-gene-23.0-mRNA-1 protein AED:1.00 eAED:1.00 QI:0/0/0/0/1/1/3/0/267
MEKVNKNRSEPPVLRSGSGKKSGGRVVAEISSRNIITRDTETPQELNQVAIEESSSQEDLWDNSEVYRSVSGPGENMTTPDHVVVTRESWEQLQQNYETLQLQMSTLLQQVKANISTGSNREVKKDLFRVKDKGNSRSEIEESDSENSAHSASSGLRESERKRAREEKYKGKPVLRSLEPSKVAAFLEKFQVYETNLSEGSGSEDEESVFVGVVEVSGVEEDYEEESEDFMVGSLDPVDLGEILVEDEFEVGGDVGKPHVTDKKVQQ